MRILPLAATALMLAAVHPAAAQRGCRVPPQQYFAISTGSLEMEPGQAQTLSAGISPGPGIVLALPRGCAVRWSLVGPARARIDARGRLAVAAGAAIGTAFRVRAVMGRDTAIQEVHVVDPRLRPLAGTWQQSAVTCTPPAGALEPVRELTLHRNGRYEVTFVPFEVYHDYWGRYTWDMATGAVMMAVESGNQVPEGLDLRGTMRVADGRLTLDAMWLGQPAESQTRACTYTFTR
jgi:hypothetical protein